MHASPAPLVSAGSFGNNISLFSHSVAQLPGRAAITGDGNAVAPRLLHHSSLLKNMQAGGAAPASVHKQRARRQTRTTLNPAGVRGMDAGSGVGW